MNGEDEPWLSREELVEREHQARLREHKEWQKRIEERCREAEIRFWTAHPWLIVRRAAWLAGLVRECAGKAADYQRLDAPNGTEPEARHGALGEVLLETSNNM